MRRRGSVFKAWNECANSNVSTAQLIGNADTGMWVMRITAQHQEIAYKIRDFQEIIKISKTWISQESAVIVKEETRDYIASHSSKTLVYFLSVWKAWHPFKLSYSRKNSMLSNVKKNSSQGELSQTWVGNYFECKNSSKGSILENGCSYLLILNLRGLACLAEFTENTL